MKNGTQEWRVTQPVTPTQLISFGGSPNGNGSAVITVRPIFPANGNGEHLGKERKLKISIDVITPGASLRVYGKRYGTNQTVNLCLTAKKCEGGYGIATIHRNDRNGKH